MPKIVDHNFYRKELLMKCFDLFAEKGYRSLTTRQLAKKLDISTGTLYHYFPSKEALFIQLIEEITDKDILSATDELKNLQSETISEKVLALGQFIKKNEDFFQKQTFLMVNVFQQEEIMQEKLLEAVRRSNRRYQKEIMYFLDIEKPEIANHISCLLDGLIFQRILDPQLVSIDEQMELVAQILDSLRNK